MQTEPQDERKPWHPPEVTTIELGATAGGSGFGEDGSDETVIDD